jgi:hypothetical protein
MTDAEILTLVDRLERCLLAKNEFHHRDHLAVAVGYLCRRFRLRSGAYARQPYPICRSS